MDVFQYRDRIGKCRHDSCREQFVPGETIEALVKITGGKTDQEIGGLSFSVNCTYQAVVHVEIEANADEDETWEEGDGEFEEDGEEAEAQVEEKEVTRTAVLQKFKLSDAFTIAAGDEHEIPLSFELPQHTPLTLGKTKVWLRTGLDIKKGLDSGDKDYIEVTAEGLVAALFDSLQELGLEIRQAECETAPKTFRRNLPFAQEFEFKPVSGPFRGRLDELEVICFPEADQLEVFLEIDRKARNMESLLLELMNRDETQLKYTFTENDLPYLTGKLHEIIDNWS